MLKKRLTATIIALCMSLTLTMVLPVFTLSGGISTTTAYAKKKHTSKRSHSSRKKSRSRRGSRKRSANAAAVSMQSFAQNGLYVVTIPTSSRNVYSVQKKIQQKTGLSFTKDARNQLEARVSGYKVPSIVSAAAQIGYRAYTMLVTPPPADPIVPKPVSFTPPVVKVTVNVPSTENTATTNSNRKYIICLDPGHGGIETGAVTKDANGNIVLKEKDINLDVALKVEALLKNAGYEVVMTRRTDDTVTHPYELSADLHARADIANQANANIFVSIHHNASDLQTAGGTEVYSYPASTTGAVLSRCLQDEIVKSVWSGNQAKDRGTNTANFSVLRNTIMTAALSEAAFMTNPSEAALLATDSFRQQEAQGIFNGITKYFYQTQNSQHS